MRQNALFAGEYTQTPTALAFAQGGRFLIEYEGHLLVALFGNSYVRGRHVKGMKTVKIKLTQKSDVIYTYDEFTTYIGEGPASPCGLALDPGGLYFTDLHGEPENGDYHGAGSDYRVSPIPKRAASEI